MYKLVSQKLIKLEELCKEKPSISGRFEAVLDNGERAVVSRQYVPVLKNIL